MAILGDTKAVSLTLLDGVKGVLKVTNNGNTVSIGSQSSSWCHFENSANINFYFNHQIHANGGFVVYNTNTSLTDNTLALSGGGGWYMDDTTWIRSRGNKSIYHNSGILRTDGTFQVGSNGADINFVNGGNKTIGYTGRNTNNLLTLNGNLVINAQYQTTNSYSEGIRINMGSNSWTCIALGGDNNTVWGTGKAIWELATQRHDTTNKVSNFYIANNGSNGATMRLTGHVTSAAEVGWSIRPRLGIGMDPDTNYALAVTGNTLLLGNILYNASSTACTMISFRGGQYGHGITIGGGACTIVGGGESAALTAQNVAASSETLELTSDSNVYIRTNLQDNWASGKTFTFDTSGNLTVPGTIYGTVTSASCIKAPATLTTQEAIDGFLTPSTLQYALFKTTKANNIGMASNDGMLISLPWTANTYGAQIALDDATAGVMKFRGKSNTWGDWRTVIHDGNYTSYTVTKTGTGATGTWGISITGSAASCTGNAATATALTSNAGSTTQPIYFTGGKPSACSYTLGTNIVYQIHNATTGFWSAAYGMYNAAPVISVTRHNATVPTYIPGSYASTLVYGGVDTKGMLSIGYNQPVITFGGAATTGSTADAPQWWIKLTGTKSTTYNLDNVGKTGSSNSVAEMYIIGATVQANATTTYSKSAVRMTSANCVIAASFKATNGTNGCEMIYDANSKSIKFVFS